MMCSVLSKKTFPPLIILVFLFFVFCPMITLADYTPLQELPGVGQPEAGEGSVNFTAYIQGLVLLLIGIAAALAVIFIMIGGIQYVTTDSLSNKQDGKEKIINALLGLVLALASWLILYTINPLLLGNPNGDNSGFIVDQTTD